jgi:hypothetical protein
VELYALLYESLSSVAFFISLQQKNILYSIYINARSVTRSIKIMSCSEDTFAASFVSFPLGGGRGWGVGGILLCLTMENIKIRYTVALLPNYASTYSQNFPRLSY